MVIGHRLPWHWRVSLGLLSFCLFCVPAWANAGSSGDWSRLNVWIGHSEDEKLLQKHSLLEDKEVRQAFRKTVGDRIFKKFAKAYKNGGRYFQTEYIRDDHGRLQVFFQDLVSDFYTTIYIDTKEKHVDVCWTNPIGNSAMYMHDGRKLPVFDLACGDDGYEHYTSASVLEENVAKQARLIGTWEGQFLRNYGRGQIVQNWVKLVVTGDPNVPRGLHYKMSWTTKIDRGYFACTKAKSSTVLYEGDVDPYGLEGRITFNKDKVSPKACDVPAFLVYDWKDGSLHRWKIPEEVLRKVR